MLSARQRNVKGVHLSGHATLQNGFAWNADDAASTKAEAEMPAVVAIIGRASEGAGGSVEFANLNACSTYEMARLLREAGVPHVLCWRTPVHDDIAREMCGHFIRDLMRQSKGGSGRRDYPSAFDAAADVCVSAPTPAAPRASRARPAVLWSIRARGAG